MKSRQRRNWPETALTLAFNIAEARSEDMFVQVGACAIKRDKSILLGYNGAPSGVEIDQSDRDVRRDYMSHAERNVLNYCTPGDISLLACTHNPCKRCIVDIRQMLVDTVYFCEHRADWQEVLKIADKLGVELINVSRDSLEPLKTLR